MRRCCRDRRRFSPFLESPARSGAGESRRLLVRRAPVQSCGRQALFSRDQEGDLHTVKGVPDRLAAGPKVDVAASSPGFLEAIESLASDEDVHVLSGSHDNVRQGGRAEEVPSDLLQRSLDALTQASGARVHGSGEVASALQRLSCCFVRNAANHASRRRGLPSILPRREPRREMGRQQSASAAP